MSLEKLIRDYLQKHKVFISYYHKEDQFYRNQFETKFHHLFISKSVQPGEIKTDLSTEYIKRLIREGYISDSSVIIVLVGKKTYCRKHVDWEISAGLNKNIKGASGLMGILLPGFIPGSDTIPFRLLDNYQSGYAQIYYWNDVTNSDDNIRSAVNKAFQSRENNLKNINNSSKQMGRNLCQ